MPPSRAQSLRALVDSVLDDVSFPRSLSPPTPKPCAPKPFIRFHPYHSPHRPFLSASTGTSHRFPSSTITLSRPTCDRVQSVLQRAWADSTLSGYESQLKAFHRFCEAEKIPASLRLPADEFLLCAFVASRAGSCSLSTARSAVSALRAWHVLHGFPWAGGLRLEYVLNGVDRLSPPSQPLRSPITRKMLCLLHQGLNPALPLEACVLAAALVAFWTQSRLGELLCARVSDMSSVLVPLRSHLGSKTTDLGSRPLRYPWTKTRRHHGDHTIITRQTGPSDPIAALDAHLAVNVLPASAPLFAYVDSRGRPRCLTKRMLLLVCNRVWKAHGYPHTTGHSFRIGGTTELLVCGVSPEIVKKMGRWSSDSFQRYWRRVESVVPRHVEHLLSVPPRSIPLASGL